MFYLPQQLILSKNDVFEGRFCKESSWLSIGFFIFLLIPLRDDSRSPEISEYFSLSYSYSFSYKISAGPSYGKAMFLRTGMAESGLPILAKVNCLSANLSPIFFSVSTFFESVPFKVSVFYIFKMRFDAEPTVSLLEFSNSFLFFSFSDASPNLIVSSLVFSVISLAS